MPVLWGFDTAWNSYGNMLRGLRFTGRDAIGIVRVSFQPWDVVTEKGVLPEKLQKNLDDRLANVALTGKKVDIALNLDGGEPTIHEVYGGLDANSQYVGDPASVAMAYALLIDATAASVEKAGYRVVSAAPFNEPDYYWNGTPVHVFHEIDKLLKDYNQFPRFRNIRISGGNTLNCDQAFPWYDQLKDYLDEGNTHQLAGDFDHYADFFKTVRADGKYATADELHNVMEAIVGSEYGMQTGIWWGSAEQARGELCKATFGNRLAYAENRKAWSAAAVYRAPSGKVQAFLGCSERQALPSTFNLVSLDHDVYVNGHGPAREYVVSLPGDPNGGYQTELQRNAETMLPITWGTDIQPELGGDYMIVNQGCKLLLGGKDGKTSNGSEIVLQDFVPFAKSQSWTISEVPENIGGDFSYYHIRNTYSSQAFDDLNWNIEEGGKVIAYAPNDNGVQQWSFEYDGDGWFHIRNKQSGLYLDGRGMRDNTPVVQYERANIPSQKWRLVPAEAPLSFEAPAAPANLKAESRSASIALKWDTVEHSSDVTYAVIRGDASGNYLNTIARGLTSPEFIDNSIDDPWRHTYCVMAEDASGNRSKLSSSVLASTYAWDTLVARFPLNGSVDDETENAFSLRVNGTLRYNTGHKEGVKAANFRSQYAQLPYSLLQSPDFSIAFWTRLNSPSGTQRLFSFGTSEESSLYLLPNDNGSMRLVARNNGNTAEITTDAIPQSTWAHIAVTSENNQVKLYVNGVSVEPSAVDFGDAMPANRMLSYLGRGHDVTPAYFSGYFEDICVFKKAITPEQVLAAMNGTPSAVDSVIADSVEEVSREYFSIHGMRLSEPAETGVTIVRITYTDGTLRTFKQIAR